MNVCSRGRVKPVDATQYTQILRGIILVRYLRFTKQEKSLLWFDAFESAASFKDIEALIDRESKVIDRTTNTR